MGLEISWFCPKRHEKSGVSITVGLEISWFCPKRHEKSSLDWMVSEILRFVAKENS